MEFMYLELHYKLHWDPRKSTAAEDLWNFLEGVY